MDVTWGPLVDVTWGPLVGGTWGPLVDLIWGPLVDLIWGPLVGGTWGPLRLDLGTVIMWDLLTLTVEVYNYCEILMQFLLSL